MLIIALPVFSLAIIAVQIMATTEVGSRLLWAVHAYFSGSETRWAVAMGSSPLDDIQLLTCNTVGEVGLAAPTQTAEKAGISVHK